MSYFGKFYLVGPEATKAADWLFSADVSKAPGTGSAPRFAGEITPQNNPGEPRLAFPLNAASAEGMGRVWERLLALSSPQSGSCLVYTGAQCWELGMREGVLALWLQLWLTSGAAMGARVNQAPPPPAAVRCSLFRSSTSKDANSAPSQRKGGKSIVPFPLLLLAHPGWGRAKPGG